MGWYSVHGWQNTGGGGGGKVAVIGFFMRSYLCEGLNQLQSDLVNPCFFNPHGSQSEHILMSNNLFG